MFQRFGGLIRNVIALAMIAGPAATIGAPLPPDFVLKHLLAQDQAVLAVGERLVVAGRRFCAPAGTSPGMTVQRLGQYGAKYRAAAARIMQLTELPTITAVTADGAAARSGLRVGDAILSIDGRAFSSDAAAGRSGTFAKTGAALDVIYEALADGHAELTIRRGSEQSTVVLQPTPACAARFDVRAGRANNAYSDGITIQVSSDLVDEARGNDELAAILAHELAHNILRHPQQLRGPRPRPRVRDTEREADRLSVYLLDAAGFPPAAAVAFWNRWGRANDRGLFADRSHPGWQARVSLIDAEAAAIMRQRQTGVEVRVPDDLRAR